MLKKLAVVVVVAAISVAGMTASAALALRLTGSHDPRAKLYEPHENAAAGPERKAHPWDEPCEIAETEATVLVDLAGVGESKSPYERVRAGIGIEVRLLLTLREQGATNRTAKRLLRELEASIRADRAALVAFQRSPSEARFARWYEDAMRRNASMSRLAERLGARACVEYFGN